MNNSLKSQVISSFNLNGFSMRGDACDYLTETLSPLEDSEKEQWLEKIIDQILKQPLSVPIVDKLNIERAIWECSKNESTDDDSVLEVISAFDVPVFYYDLTRKKFLPVEGSKRRELYAPAISKGTMYKRRYAILYYRTLRNNLFSNNTESSNKMRLFTVECLLSKSSKMAHVVILGMLAQLKGDKYYLEDPSGIVELDLSQTIYHEGFFAESAFVLVEGSYCDNVLHVQEIGLPPRESSDISRIYFGVTNTFGGPLDWNFRNSGKLRALEESRDSVMFVVISDIWFDQPKVIDKLGLLFEGYASQPPSVFILMGNFLSTRRGSQHFVEIKQGFQRLGDIISSHRSLAEKSKFIIVPGSVDSSMANILPRPPLSEVIVSDLKNKIKDLVLATNPCRIRYCTQEIVIIRDDLVTKLCRNSIHFPETKDIPSHFAKTIICQAHLAPVPLNVSPVYWNYDAALQLYPCPDLIIVGEQQKSFTTTYNNCLVVNPGSFSKCFTFKAYYPATKEVEDCQIPDDE